MRLSAPALLLLLRPRLPESRGDGPVPHGRTRSRADLPRIDTDMYGPREKDSRDARSQSSAPTYETDYRYKVPRSPDRPSRPARDEFLSPEVTKSGRNREEVSYYSSSRGPRSSRYSERPVELVESEA